jgi:hypothetical protein
VGKHDSTAINSSLPVKLVHGDLIGGYNDYRFSSYHISSNGLAPDLTPRPALSEFHSGIVSLNAEFRKSCGKLSIFSCKASSHLAELERDTEAQVNIVVTGIE